MDKTIRRLYCDVCFVPEKIKVSGILRMYNNLRCGDIGTDFEKVYDEVINFISEYEGPNEI